MTREEINRRISELRDEWDFHPFYAAPGEPKDWHADSNWPTLLREMPEGGISTDPDPRTYGCTAKEYGPEYLEYQWSLDLGEAVCLAWLKWKESL